MAVQKGDAVALLILDVGSSSVRALLLDDALAMIPNAIARRSIVFDYTSAGGASIAVDALRATLEACIDDLLQRFAHLPIEAVGMATFVGNLCGVDAHNTPITPLLTYADTRALDEALQLRQALDENAIHQRTGCPLTSAYWPSQLRWMQSAHALEVAQVARWQDIATTCYRTWFGHDVPCSLSVASWGGLLNRQSATWDAAWLADLGVESSQLPTLADYDAVQLGLSAAYAARWPSLADVPFYLAVGDGATANLGTGGDHPELLVLTVGTTAALRIVTPTLPNPLPSGLWSYRVDQARHLTGGATTEGGNVFAWASSSFGLDAAQIEAALSASMPDSHGLTVLPLFAGERSPNYRADAVGTIHGLRLSTRPVDIAQAALESVALRLANIAALLPRPAQVLAGGGALAASPAWAQIMADALNLPLCRVDAPEVTARGVGALISGQRVKIACGEVLQPRPEAIERLAAARARQTQLYERLYGVGFGFGVL